MTDCAGRNALFFLYLCCSDERARVSAVVVCFYCHFCLKNESD